MKINLKCKHDLVGDSQWENTLYGISQLKRISWRIVKYSLIKQLFNFSLKKQVIKYSQQNSYKKNPYPYLEIILLSNIRFKFK